MFVIAFVIAGLTATTLPPRYYYPAVELSATDRATCNALADSAADKEMRVSVDPSMARLREVDAFVACAKARHE